VESLGEPPIMVGRYALCAEIASGGMATVHHGLLRGPGGFSRTVAIKRLHPQHAKDREFSRMFRDEARLAARIHHPHVVTTLDVAAFDDELLLVLEYVHGEALGVLMHAAQESEQGALALDVVSGVACAALHGLHAAHEATDEDGTPLLIVHRDVSPPNILVGADGIPRVLDFGIAKAAGRLHTTRNGELKGKLAYMAPEQLAHGPVDRRTDVYAMGVVLWEMLTLQRLFVGDNDGAIVARMLQHRIDPPSRISTRVSKEVDAIVMRALSAEPSKRFQTAREMALALETAIPVASATSIAAWVEELAGPALSARARAIAHGEKNARLLPVENAIGPSGRPASHVTPPARETNAAVIESDPAGTSPIPAVSQVATSSKRDRPWAAYGAFLLALAALLLTTVWRADHSTTPAATPASTSSAEASAGESVKVAPPSASASAPVVITAPSAAPTSRPPSPRSVRPKPAVTIPPTTAKSAHCDWHQEDGIWVPTCR
jgi:eukaryotic-like serine/threonine-protein kinase